MFNYRLTIKAETMDKLNAFNDTVRLCATRSTEVATERKRLEAIRDNTENTKEVMDKAISDLAKLDETWKKERKEYDIKLFGGTDKNGNKCGGYCDNISKDFYKAYCAYITECDNVAMYNATHDFLVENSLNAKVRDSAVSQFTTELLMLIGGKFNSNSKLAKGENFITTINKRAFKKFVFGALIDIINKSNIRVADAEKTTK